MDLVLTSSIIMWRMTYNGGVETEYCWPESSMYEQCEFMPFPASRESSSTSQGLDRHNLRQQGFGMAGGVIFGLSHMRLRDGGSAKVWILVCEVCRDMTISTLWLNGLESG